jgi:succinate dehydrogenase/fumarate reductase flavoprotein subunit
VLNAAFTGNTGDGIVMAQEAGAALWHMWHYHGVYGFKHPDPDYPVGIRPKRLPDWIPGEPARKDVKMPWIVLDRTGRRYMNEYPPYMQDTSARPMAFFDTVTQTYPGIPSWMIVDEPGRATYPLVSPTFNDDRLRFEWSEASLRELEMRIFARAETIGDLAHGLGVPETALRETLDKWNNSCSKETDAAFGRPGTSMVKIETPPYYYAQIWPICSNTHGGPVHDAGQRVLNGFDEPIPRLFAAGELGGVFGHLYISGGNLAECFIGGRIAGQNAAALNAAGEERDLPSFEARLDA